jgi:hypothetical protein
VALRVAMIMRPDKSFGMRYFRSRSQSAGRWPETLTQHGFADIRIPSPAWIGTAR